MTKEEFIDQMKQKLSSKPKDVQLVSFAESFSRQRIHEKISRGSLSLINSKNNIKKLIEDWQNENMKEEIKKLQYNLNLSDVCSHPRFNSGSFYHSVLILLRIIKCIRHPSKNKEL
jgi:hypothetical protein